LSIRLNCIFPASVLLGNSGVTLSIQATDQKAEVEKQATTVDATVLASAIVEQDKSGHRNLSKEAIKARLLAKEEAEDSGTTPAWCVN